MGCTSHCCLFMYMYVSSVCVCGAQVSENEVLDLLERILYSPQSSQFTRDYALNAVMKLSTR